MDEKLVQIQKLLDAAEGNLQSARNLLRSVLNTEGKPLDVQEKAANLDGNISADIVQGIFDGEKMIADGGKEYPVPANYASKSKLVEGDTLKLTIAEDGSFIYKQINPVERKNLVGTLSQTDGTYVVNAGGKDYKVLTASVTFYKAQPGDQVTVIVPAAHESTWAAMENVISSVPAVEQVSVPTNPDIVEPEIIVSEDNSQQTTGDQLETGITQPSTVNQEVAADELVTPPATEFPVTETPVENPTAETTEPQIQSVEIDSQSTESTNLPPVNTDSNVPDIEFPAGNENLSDDEMLENLKNNLKNIQTPDFVSPQTVIEETRKADELINNQPKTENSKGDQPISELEI